METILAAIVKIAYSVRRKVEEKQIWPSLPIFVLSTTSNKLFHLNNDDKKISCTRVVFCWDQPFLLGWVFFFLENPFSVGLADQLFQPASNQVETVEKALA